MRSLLLLTLLVITINQVFAQTQLPDFGNFSDEEKSIKICDFDKEAEAMILFDVAKGNYNDEHNLITEKRVRLKILKQKGIEKANIEIPYYSKDNFETISNLKAVIYSVGDDGSTTIKELNRSATFTQKLNDRVSVVKFTMPNVKVGSIIDYEYTSTMQTYGGLDDWYFQSNIPTKFSQFSITILPNLEFAYVVHKIEAMPIKITNDKDVGGVGFEMADIPGLRDEPYMDAPRDYLQRVEFQLSKYKNAFGSNINFLSSWNDLAKDLISAQYFGRNIDKKLSNADEIISKANLSASPVLKVKAIYNYVRNNFSWNGIYTKFAEDGIKKVWENKKGTSGEINLILINLLKQADIEVYPLLVSERTHGKVTTDYPILEQFNNVAAYVIINDKKYVLDATEANTPAEMIPFDLLNTNAFIVNIKKNAVIHLSGDKASYKNTAIIDAVIDKNGVVSGNAYISSSNYARTQKISDYKEDKQKFRNDNFIKSYTNMRLDSFEVANVDNDSLPLDQSFKFTMPAESSGNYKLVNVNLFTGLEENPFRDNNRFTNINYGCTYTNTYNESFELPENMKPEDLPKNIQMVMPDKSIVFTRATFFEKNIIYVQLAFKINRTVFTPTEYADVKEFYKKLNSLLNEQIVLAKK